MSIASVSVTDSLKIKNVRGILYLSIILALLNPIFFFLDFAMYPNHSSTFIGLRIFLQMVAGIYMAASLWKPAFVRQHDQLLLVILGLAVTGAVQLMVFLADGYASPYYAGITLSCIALGMLTFLNRRSLAIFFVGVVGPYVTPGLVGWAAIDRPPLFATHLIFMLMTLFIVFIAMRFRLEMAHKEKTINILEKSLFAAQKAREGQFSGQVLRDVYSVDRLIGYGGMGEVYSGHHLRTHRRVAIKILHPHLVERRELLDRFRREAQIAGQLESEYIVEVIDVDEQDGQPFIVMELLLGENLADYIKRKAPLSLNEVADFVEQIAAGLHVAHRSLVVHRDLKPTNVFLQRSAERTKLKIVDFGISKIQGSTVALTQDSSFLGTPSFMAPEQATNMKTDERTDIFALGALTYMMLTGHQPFFGDSVPGVLYAVCQARPVALRHYRDDATAALESVLALSLAKKPNDRYQSVAEFSRDFNDAVSGTSLVEVVERAKKVNWGAFELVSGSNRDEPSPVNQTTELDT
jgi:serine/threonine protein kinase